MVGLYLLTYELFKKQSFSANKKTAFFLYFYLIFPTLIYNAWLFMIHWWFLYLEFYLDPLNTSLTFDIALILGIVLGMVF
jgi:hypothetical protein